MMHSLIAILSKYFPTFISVKPETDAELYLLSDHYYFIIFTLYILRKLFFLNIYQAQSGKMKVEMQIRKEWFRIQVLSLPTK